MPERPTLEFLRILSYKNVRDLHLRWSDRMVLFGPNGAGKTNILEAVALALGTDVTMRQIAARAVEPEPGAISMYVRDHRSLPVAPAKLSVPDEPRSFIEGGDFLTNLEAFWSRLSPRAAGGSWPEAIASCGLPLPVHDILVEAGLNPLIRYSLRSITAFIDLRARADDDGPGAVSRTFARTLCVYKPSGKRSSGAGLKQLANLKEDLPAAFDALRSWFALPASSRGPIMDLIDLPPTQHVPLDAVWLAAARGSDEACADLDTAHDRAWDAVTGLVFQLLCRVRPDLDEQTRNDNSRDAASFWLMARAADRANVELRSVLPGLRCSISENYFPYRLTVEQQVGASIRTATLGADSALEGFSAGERIWVDYAFAHAAQAMDDLGRRCAWVNLAMLYSKDDFEELVGKETADELRCTAPYLAHEELLEALSSLERRFGDRTAALAPIALRARPPWFHDFMLAHEPEPVRRAVVDPACLHLYDEPERHMHPLAQRCIARALTDPAPWPVTIATHSPYFLALPGWDHHQVLRDVDGHAAVSSLDPHSIIASSELAKKVGLTNGELLASVRYVLIVEGPADAVVLEALYGPQLNESGVLLLPLHGIDEVASLAELTLFDRYLDVRLGILADHTTVDRVRGHQPPRTKEERALRDLCQRRSVHVSGIAEEDIIECLDDQAIRSEVPDFPGWTAVRRDRRRNEKLKEAISRLSRGARFDVATIRRIAEAQRGLQIPPSPALVRAVESVLLAASATPDPAHALDEERE